MTSLPAEGPAFFWDVELPTSTRRAMGAPRPRAALVCGDDRRRLAIPLALGRDLLKARGEGFEPRDEGELLAEAREREGRLAWEWLVRALNRRDLTAQEAAERLGREGFGEEAASRAVGRAREARFIDDLRYADTFARQRSAQGWGRRKVELELERRGVRVGELEGWSEARFDAEAEAGRARELLARRALPARNPYEKLVRFLVGRGFDYGTAKTVARERIDEG